MPDNQITESKLFFAALIPDRALRITANAFKRDFGRFGSSKATEIYTHITLKAPFKCSGYDIESVMRWFYEMSLQQKPFHLYLNGFGAFHNKRHPVIYINPAKNNE